MRFSIDLPSGFRKVTNTMLPITHCLVGKRKEEFERPDDALITKSMCVGVIPKERRMTAGELAIIRQWRWKAGHGKYALKALEWVTSEADGESAKARWPEPEWDQSSFQILPATCTVNDEPSTLESNG